MTCRWRSRADLKAVGQTAKVRKDGICGRHWVRRAIAGFNKYSPIGQDANLPAQSKHILSKDQALQSRSCAWMTQPHVDRWPIVMKIGIA